MRCHGAPCEKFERTKAKMWKLKLAAGVGHDITVSIGDNISSAVSPFQSPAFGGCQAMYEARMTYLSNTIGDFK